MQISFILKIVTGLCFLVGPLYLKASPDSIIIKGNIYNYAHQVKTGDSVQLFIQDPVAQEEQSYYGPIKADGSFRIVAPLNNVQDVLFKYTERLRLFLKPGDELTLNFDAKDMLNTITMSGRSATLNREFVAYQHAWLENIKQTYGREFERRKSMDSLMKNTSLKFKAVVLSGWQRTPSFIANT